MSMRPREEPIAVIGMECIFPQAPDMKTYWQNILNEVNAIGEPLEEWEAERYLEKGYVSTSRGGYLRDLYRFNPAEFGVMPNSVEGGEPDQFLALAVAKRALADAGEQYLDPDYNHRDTGIILGHSTYLHRGQINGGQHFIVLDQTMDILKVAMPNMTDEQSDKIRSVLKKNLPFFGADTCPSMVPNVMTGRIANRLNFTGPNYILDAACASSLLSVGAAIDELRKGNSRMMLAGGVNASLPAEVSVIFTLLDALSDKGNVTPFSANSDGTLLGEGLGVVVLKRLSDALEDGDRIYSVVHGVGQSSDGKGHSLLAPSVDGEALAVQRAYDSTGINPDTISLIEAHGTGISLGDQTEINSLRKIFGERQGEQGNIAIGSVKSMISHTIPAAGIASFIKMSLSLYHKILPPTLCDEINQDLHINETPFYLNTKAKPWIEKEDTPRRAAINSFGFGGVNAHAILEEAPAEAIKPEKCAAWTSELCIFQAADMASLNSQLDELTTYLEHRDDVSLDDVAYTLFEKAKENQGEYRLALLAEDAEALVKKIAQAKKRLAKKNEPFMGKNGVLFSNQPVEGKLAFMFPGEGSQYMNMLSDLAMHFDSVREWFDFWNGLYEETPGSSRTDIVFPAESELTDERRAYLDKRLHDMDVGSEAVFVAGQAMHALMEHFEITPDVMVGHSSGESSALVASRAVPWKDRDQLAGFVRKINTIYSMIEEEGGIERGALMAIALIDKEKIEAQIKDSNVVIAMENCQTQTIVYGSVEEMNALSDALVKEGAVCEILPFDRGYHTEAFAPMRDGFAQFYKEVDVVAPKTPLYSCASAKPFPKAKKDVQTLAARQWSEKVRFIETIEQMHEDGVRTFVEVGPGGKLASFADQILRGKDAIITASNVEQKAGLYQFQELLGKLFVNDKAGLEKLFAEREVNVLDFAELTKPRVKGMHLQNGLPRIFVTDELVDAIQDVKPQQPSIAPQQNDDDPYADYRPFFTEITELSDTHFVGLSHLTLDDIFLQDHILSGKGSDDPSLMGLACVPLMVSLEIMAEAAAVLAKSIDLRVIENVRTFDWIALDDEEVMLEVRAEAIADKAQAFNVEIYNHGKKVVSAEYHFDPATPYTIPSLPPLSYNPEPYHWSEDYEMYFNGMFHGPVFRTVRHIKGWSDKGIDAELSRVSLMDFFREGDTPKLIINPALMDSLNQLTAFWMCQQIGPIFNNFPATVERIEFFANCPADCDNLHSRARKQESHNGRGDGHWDFECFDGDQLLVRIQNLQNVFFEVSEAFYNCRLDPLNGWLGTPLQETDTSLEWQLPHLSKEFCSISNSVFLRTLAHAILSHEERTEWAAIQQAHVLEKSRWLFARAAIKEAVRYWIYQQTGELVYPSDVDVRAVADGYQVTGVWAEYVAAPHITLQETEGYTIATVEMVETLKAVQTN